ncbi:isoprenylcysteine carboxylmethyltransferase family protein [candidate division TA06 bacterium]|nr:isoprenylcysteine carboxylmethyltransferase family protein [candidate division TA06 bacterium]
MFFYCAILLINRGRGTPAPFDPPSEFVVLGPYRYVRNPMMIGGLGADLAVSLILSSLSGILFTLLLSLLVHLFIIRVEEPGLQQRFGQPYFEYKKKVPRWIPKIK